MTSQDHQMRAILLRLEMLSHGSVQAWNPSGGHSGEPDDKIVTFIAGKRENPPHIRWRIIYNRQATDQGRKAVIDDAQDELDSWVKRTSKVEASISEREIVIGDFAGWSPEAVAQARSVTPTSIRKWRAEAGLGTEDGRPLLPITDSVDDRDAALQLWRQGQSTRKIAQTLGCHQTQVMRWIRRVAA